MRKYSIAIFFCFLASCLSGFAQEDIATKILADSNEKSENLRDFSADMMYSLENPNMANPVSKKGKIHYAKGKYVVIMDDQEIYCDGKSLWIHIPADEEVSILNYDPEEAPGFQQVFSLFQLEGIQARYDGKATIDGIIYDQIYLTVSNPEVDFNQAKIWINETTKLSEKLITIDRRQTATTYSFANILIDQDLPDSTFVFDTRNFKGDIYDERE